ncbi:MULTISPECIES: PA2169 family four-helix-bundle protein [Francisella]|uniref:DUF2383 domain-containing protein n=1 Tax=Francisella opportunistica TaxID=2016517 RepID=A0A345JPF8_9GAMM|nr:MULTISPECIES: PA2169 family four-helix-bundle protein [Francisella]APC90875.1 hypothetical protein BBG19_0137 [Francisella sp. MA067296]AXH29204.1 DUF2383 domain-containing protein [Francisella opportunistica]AXH30855.1 aldehyde dehydrogenase [Francisella opportunistica]AXH32500.1 aldehyde dehydrogenase [Francisella opportunistica]
MDSKIINILNNLIEVSRDGENGFRTSANNVSDQKLKTILLKRAEGCKEAVKELQKYVVEYGGEVEDSTSILGNLHRGWVNIKSMLTGYNDHAILVECERGEGYAKKAYAEALEVNDIPSNIRELIQKQNDSLLENYTLVCKLKEEYKEKY